MPTADYRGWLRWRFELVGFYDSPIDVRHRSLSSWDGLLTVWQLRRGSVVVQHAGGQLTATAGGWMLIPPGVARQHRFSVDAHIRSIRCAISDPTGQPPGLGREPCVIDHASDDLQTAADMLAANVPGEDGAIDGFRWQGLPLRPDSWAAMQAGVLAWTACVLSRLGVNGAAQPIEARVAAAQRLLVSRRGPAALPWPALREATGLSRPQLDRLFHQHCGSSVRAWSEARLLTDACRALESQRDAVKTIATRLGFGDASHFCRWFRARTHASPQDWRRHIGV